MQRGGGRGRGRSRGRGRGSFDRSRSGSRGRRFDRGRGNGREDGRRGRGQSPGSHSEGRPAHRRPVVVKQPEPESDSDQEAPGDVLGSEGTAYQRLLASLHGTAGDDGEDSDAQDNGGSDGGESGEGGDEDDAGADSDSNDSGGDDDDGDDETEGGSPGDGPGADAEFVDDVDADADADDRAAPPSDGSGGGDSDDGVPPSRLPVKRRKGAALAPPAPKRPKTRPLPLPTEADGAAPPPAAGDPFTRHMERVLTTGDIARVAPTAPAPAFVSCGPVAGVAGGTWESSGPPITPGDLWPPDLAESSLRPRLRSRWEALGAGATPPPPTPTVADPTVPPPPGSFASPLQRTLLGALRTYRDVLFCTRPPPPAPPPPPGRQPPPEVPSTASTATSSPELDASGNPRDVTLDAVLIHVLDHVLCGHARIAANAAKLARHRDAVRARTEALRAAAATGKPRKGRAAAVAALAAAAAAAPPPRLSLLDASMPIDDVSIESLAPVVPGAIPPDPGEDPECRDQGFTRPSVLLLFPLRSVAHAAVMRLLELAPAAQGRDDAVANRQRFESDYGPTGDGDSSDEGEGGKQRGKRLKPLKPGDHRSLFGCGANVDDHFRLGLKLTRASVRLYADFYGADIIIASPLGLATHMEERRDESGTEADFLSSIEVVVADRCDVLGMQNWAHVTTVFDRLGRLPRSLRGVDVTRVRRWYLDGQSRCYRQTVLLSCHPFPELAALARAHCGNAAGRLRVAVTYPGLLPAVGPAVRQLCVRVTPPSLLDAADARFQHFTSSLWPRVRASAQPGTLVVVPSYFDYVRLRDWLAKEDAGAALCCEYTPLGDTGRARARFGSGASPVMLYTERAHFYHRLALRGAREVVFYAPPVHAHYYAEVLNTMGGADAPSCTLLFTKYDKPQLEQIVGTARAAKMLASPAPAFIFC